MIGGLDKVTSESGNTQEPFYNSMGRVEKLQYGIQGEIFEYAYSYDTFGRPASVRYPATAGQQPVVVENEYDAFGTLERVIDTSDPVNAHELWHADVVDAAGRVREETLGGAIKNRFTIDPTNGDLTDIQTTWGEKDTLGQWWHYEHEANGNVESREDKLFNQFEMFFYDARNRLHTVASNTGALSTKFDAWGNILNRNGSTYDYDSSLRLTSAAGVTYTYDDFGRALTRTEGGEKFTFDDYTWFNKPTVISSTHDTVRFDYDAFQQRVKKESTITGKKTIYAGGLYERTSDPNSGEEVQTFTIMGLGKPIAQIRRTEQLGLPVDEVRYLSTDHLGSTSLVMTKDDNDEIEVVERPSYDAWGRRRAHA
ncbi:MAG: hypothetical protein HOV81_38510, partial [Kofleriaceae bacterium]|nr:hypothetical protein [Kofleriaceae bacterium]